MSHIQADWLAEIQELPANKTVFYTIEKAIKQYRKFIQCRFDEKVGDITVDQAMVLNLLEQQPDLMQSQIATLMFKDNAAMTRIINLIIKKGYLIKTPNPEDRRKHLLTLTLKANQTMSKLRAVRTKNQEAALQGITENQLTQISEVLEQLIQNCQVDA